MTPAPVTALYAGTLSLVYVALAARVIRRRMARKISIGSGGDPDLERAARVHANFAEYVPLALVLLLLSELSGEPRALLHAAGLVLVAGRLAHIVGLSTPRGRGAFRTGGMAATFTVLVGLSVALLVAALP